MIVVLAAVACALNLALTFSTCSSSSSASAFIYVGCTQQKYEAGSPYESELNSVLTSIVNSASMSKFNKLKSEEVKGVFQCRGDLSNWECVRCVRDAVSRVGTYCVGTCGGALQLEGCFVKYDNISFLGVQDKTVVWSKCGGQGEGGAADLDALLAYLQQGGQYFLVGGSGDVQGMVQCVEDLSMEQCGDCLAEAIPRLRTECATSAWGDMFLGKCYARFSPLRSASASASPAHHYPKSGELLLLALTVAAAASLSHSHSSFSFLTSSIF